MNYESKIHKWSNNTSEATRNLQQCTKDQLAKLHQKQFRTKPKKRPARKANPFARCALMRKSLNRNTHRITWNRLRDPMARWFVRHCWSNHVWHVVSPDTPAATATSAPNPNANPNPNAPQWMQPQCPKLSFLFSNPNSQACRRNRSSGGKTNKLTDETDETDITYKKKMRKQA